MRHSFISKMSQKKSYTLMLVVRIPQSVGFQTSATIIIELIVLKLVNGTCSDQQCCANMSLVRDLCDAWGRAFYLAVVGRFFIKLVWS